tara:strand:+ start:544 stop:921 length:378 start_codon:yes stop_codon:yes gene_type:complete
MKLHHTKYKDNYKKYILSTIETGYNDEELINDKEKIEYLFDRFYSEYGFEVKRLGKYKAMSEWLSGLALDIEYFYDDIVKLAIEMGSIDENPSDKLINKVCNNYWDFMANVILSFEPRINNKGVQ